MSFRGLSRDIRDSLGSLSRRGFDIKFRGRSHGAVYELHDEPIVIQSSCWANLPLELLRDVIQRLEGSETTWPARKNVVAFGAVCRSWREMCREIVQSPEYSGKLTFPISLKQPGFRDGTMQCFIKRNKSNLTYHLFLCLSPVLLVENGKFLLSAKRNRRTTCTEYVISMDADNISRSKSTYIGKVRSNFLGTKFIIYDTQPPHNITPVSTASPPGPTSHSFRLNSASITSQPGPTRFHSKRVSPKVPIRNHPIAQVSYELNVLGTRGPRRMHCAMRSIPASAVGPGGVVPGRPELLHRSLMDDSFRSGVSFSKRIDEFASARFSDIGVGPHDGGNMCGPLVLKNKAPRWHEQLQCWCLNFRGRVTVASVKNFQLIASGGGGGVGGPAAGQQSQSSSDQDKVILQFGKVGKDMFTMDYRYPLSAFQAFAICLSSFDTKLACE